MNKQPKLWEILAALIPIIAGIVIWLWNLGTQVKEHEIRIQNLEVLRNEYKQDIKEISNKLETILIKMETKADRRND